MRRMKNWPRKSDQVEDVDASENLKSGDAYERPRKGSQEEDVDEWWWWSQVRKKIDEKVDQVEDVNESVKSGGVLKWLIHCDLARGLDASI